VELGVSKRSLNCTTRTGCFRGLDIGTACRSRLRSRARSCATASCQVRRWALVTPRRWLLLTQPLRRAALRSLRLGMPDLTLIFGNPRIMDDVSLHPCVRCEVEGGGCGQNPTY